MVLIERSGRNRLALLSTPSLLLALDISTCHIDRGRVNRYSIQFVEQIACSLRVVKAFSLYSMPFRRRRKLDLQGTGNYKSLLPNMVKKKVFATTLYPHPLPNECFLPSSDVFVQMEECFPHLHTRVSALNQINWICGWNTNHFKLTENAQAFLFLLNLIYILHCSLCAKGASSVRLTSKSVIFINGSNS